MWEKNYSGRYQAKEGVDAILGKDGTTTYYHRGNEYDNLEDVPVPHWEGIDKAGEFAGNLILSSPTLRTVLPAVGNVLSKIPPLPGEEQFAESAGDSAEMWGVDRRVGEAAGYLAYPGLGEIRPAGKLLNNIAETVFNAKRRGNSLIDPGTGAVIRSNDGIIDNNVFAIKGSGSGITGGDLGSARDVRLPEGVSARKWFQKVDENRIREEVLSQGGTEFQAKQIYKDHYNKLEGPKGIKATIKELNNMWKLWAPNTQIKLVSNTETGGKKMMMMTKKGDVRTWEFDHDHIQAVINTNRPEGGLKGANMADNIEIMFRAMNREKSNRFELDGRLLRELGVPYDFKEFIFNKLNPDLIPEGIPQRWKEVFSKSILNDYYELKPNTPSSKHSALMGKLINKYKKVFTNKQLLADIEYLEDIPFWKKYPPNEIPKWAQILEMPNDPLTDKFWNQLPPRAKKRWANMVRRKHQDLKFDIGGYTPSKGRYRIQPDD